MTPGTYNFKQKYSGNTFNGVQITMSRDVDDVDTPIDLTGALFDMQLKASRSSNPVKKLNRGNGITIVSETGGVIQIDKFLVDLTPAKYLYDLKVTFPNGEVYTYITGTFEVKQNLI